MVIVVDKRKVDEALKSIRDNGEPAVFVIGELTAQKGVQINGMDRW